MHLLLDPMILLARVKLYSRKLRLGISRDEVVLDVGSGNDPHPRADVLCDWKLEGSSDRAGEISRDARPLIVGNIENLPFVDRAFDYVICSHVLEHVKAPDRAIEELMRVGRRGYIETPSEFSEKLASMPFHRWFVRVEADTLIFTPKSRACFDPMLSAVIFGLWQERNRPFLLWSFSSSGEGLVQYSWSGVIRYKTSALQISPLRRPGSGRGGNATTRRAPRRWRSG